MRQFGVRTWDSLFTISKCTKCGEERVGGLGSVIGIEFGRFERFQPLLLKMLAPTPACKSCQGETRPEGLMYCSYYPENRSDLHVVLRLESGGNFSSDFAKVTMDGTVEPLGAVAGGDEFNKKFGTPFSVRGEWVRVVKKSIDSGKPQFLIVESGYLISSWHIPISEVELKGVRRSIDEIAVKEGLDFGDYLADSPKRNVEVKESFESWLDDFASDVRHGKIQAFAVVSSRVFARDLKENFPEYQLEFPGGFSALKSSDFRVRKGDFHVDASMAGYLITAIHRGLSFERIARDFFAPTILDRLDLMEELEKKCRPVFNDYFMSIEGGRRLQLRDKSNNQVVKSWDLYEFADEFTVDFPRFLREKMGYDLSTRSFIS